MPGLESFRHLPKAELHLHLDGSLRPATLLDLGRAAGVALPATDVETLRQRMRVDDARNLADYLLRFDLTVAVLQTADALDRVAFEIAEDAARDGVRYLELRYCPALSTKKGLTLDEVLRAAAGGLARGFARYDVSGGLIPCTLRHLSPDLSIAIAEAAVRARGRGVLGFDIAGGEATHPASPHREAFRVAARGGLGITVHAGEAAGPESIAEALFECGADRIGHGTRLAEDPMLLEYVRDREIPIEINLTSNVQTRVVARPSAHPLRRFLDEGLTVTLASDNWLMSDVTLSSEYQLASEALDLSRAEIIGLARTGIRVGFAPLADRRRIEAQAEAAWAGWQ